MELDKPLGPFPGYPEIKVIQINDNAEDTNKIADGFGRYCERSLGIEPGWCLLGVFQTQKAISFKKEVRDNNGCIRNEYDRHIITVSCLIVGRTQDRAIEDMQEKLCAEQGARNSATKDSERLSEELRKERKACAMTVIQRDEAQSALETLRQSEATASKSVKQYEQDIGNLRKALGAIRMKEILGHE